MAAKALEQSSAMSATNQHVMSAGEADATCSVAALGACGSATLAKRFIPFSDGPRDCVGRNLATTNIAAALALLLAHFKFRLADSVRHCGLRYLPVVRTWLVTKMLCFMQMGGAMGVRAKERLLSTLQIEGGMKMHAMPRVVAT